MQRRRRCRGYVCRQVIIACEKYGLIQGQHFLAVTLGAGPR